MAKIFEVSGSYIILKNNIISDMLNNYYIFSPCINHYIKISDFIKYGIKLTKNGTYKFFNDNSENNYIILKGNFNDNFFHINIYNNINSKYIMLFEDNDYEYDITNKPTIYISLNDNSLIKIPDILAIGSCTTNLYNNSLLFEREDYNNDNRLTINGNFTVNGNTNINYGSENVLKISSSIIEVNSSFIHLNSITNINGNSLYIDSKCRTIDISKTESTTDKITIDRNILIGSAIDATPTLTQYGSSYFNSDVQIGGLVVNGSEKTANLKVYGTIKAKQTNIEGLSDYAEYFEWEDSNPNNEDRVGYFVSITSDRKIQIANTSSHILGIVSATPAVIGNGAELEWNKKYLTDEWGRPIYEAVIIPAKYDEDGKEIESEHTEKRLKLNPDYDENIKYIPRSERPEWTVVGMLGMLRVRDDGSCKVGSYCKVNENGIATASESGYYVTKRFTDNIIEVFFK